MKRNAAETNAAGELERLLRTEGERDARLRFLEEKVQGTATEVGELAGLLRGNGEGGIQSQLELCRERLEVLQSQWKWIVSVVTTVAVALVQAYLKR